VHPVNAARELPRGTLIAGYRVEALLGRGGMSVVYLAEDLRLKRNVALKLLAPALAEDKRFRERFLTESELAASLDHANVIPIYQAGEVDDNLYIAMRYVEGSDLKARLRDGPLSGKETVAVALQVGGALDAAHARGLVHGDVKPSNVLIDGQGHAYLADFGLSKRLDNDLGGATEPQLMGTIDYVAPEAIRGDPVDGRADVYSLGCLLFECLVGRQPFERGNDAAVLYAHLEDDPPVTDGPADPVIARALAKSPGDRYEICAELAEDLRSALGIRARSRSRRWVAAAVVLAVIVVAALLAALLVRGTGGAAAPHGQLFRIDARSNRVSGKVSVGAQPTGVASGAGRVWVTSLGDDSVWRVDARSLSSDRIPIGGSPTGVAASGGTAYVADTVGNGLYGDPGEVTRIAGEADAPTASVRTDEAYAIASGRSGVWVARAQGIAKLATVSAFAGKLVDEISRPCCTDSTSPGLAVGARAVWMLDDAIGRRLWRIEPGGRGAVTTIPLHFVPSAVATGANAVWVTAQLDDEVARIDPATNRIVAVIPVGREPLAVAVGAGAVWVANTIDQTVMRIDPATNRVVKTIPLGSSPRALAVVGNSVWVAAGAS
jgi:serine/threonine-protein kinase